MISLKKCGISDDPNDYYLVDVLDSDKGEEKELAPEDIPYNITAKGPILKLYIRCVCVELFGCSVWVCR